MHDFRAAREAGGGGAAFTIATQQAVAWQMTSAPPAGGYFKVREWLTGALGAGRRHAPPR